ncbi:MAG: IS66 family insertion sequence element accessory protein TnpB [Gammaproteobacteria bacterium]|nr:IS66 family insertion sequence element accessory protein TnpB [Gammaproteobacteria bacterium]MCP5459912.1 IS66 family insertion sequence element accessory protein TnpB [Gammaproteobacteria bacterium]
MDASRWRGERIYLYRWPVDRRKSIDGLCALVDTELQRNPADRCLYVFCNRGGDKIKLLIWHLNGFWLLYKRLEKQRFIWPDWFEGESLLLEAGQLDQLLDGYNLNGMRPHRALAWSRPF